MLARALGAELILAPAVHRNTFNSHMTKTNWHATAADSLLDVEALKSYWLGNGLLIHTVGTPPPFPNPYACVDHHLQFQRLCRPPAARQCVPLYICIVLHWVLCSRVEVRKST